MNLHIKKFLSLAVLVTLISSFKINDNKIIINLDEGESFDKETYLKENPDKYVIEYSKNNGTFSIFNILDQSLNENTIFINNEDDFEAESKSYFEIVKSKIRLSSIESDYMNIISSKSFRVYKKPYGYIDIDLDLLKYKFTKTTSLYILDTHASYVCGKMAKLNGDSSYEEYVKNINYLDYLKIGVYQCVDEVGYEELRYGGTPILKDYYPLNKPSTVTISSTYSIGLNFGKSTTIGFEGEVLNASEEYSGQVELMASYSKTYTTTNPALSSQKDSEDTKKIQWSYIYNTQTYLTNHVQCGYIFEMNNLTNGQNSENHVNVCIDYSSKYGKAILTYKDYVLSGTKWVEF